MFSDLLQLNSLRVFDSAARLTSFKAAALELNVTPTAVSHQIRNLEEKLGTLLFERKTRVVVLTPEGEKLAQVTYSLFKKLSDVIEEISDNPKVLTVSTTSSFAAQWLVPKLELYRSRHPGIDVVVKTGEDLDSFRKDRRLDLVIRYGQFDANIENSTQLVTESFGMYASKEYLQEYPDIQRGTLIETTWKNSKLRPVTWKQYFESKDLKGVNFRLQSYEQEHHAIQAALAGQGIALVSSLLIQTPLQQGWLQKHPSGECIEGLTYYMISREPIGNSQK